jgi:hypothetical protein
LLAKELDKGLRITDPTSTDEQEKLYYIPPQSVPVYKAYQKVGQMYERPISDRTWDWWISLVTSDPVANQEIRIVIPQVYRTKDPSTGKEWLYYNKDMSANDWKGNRKYWNTLEGIIEGMPEFEYEIEPSTNKIVAGTTQVLEVKREYTIPFTKAKVEEISKYFKNPLSCIVVAPDGRRYSVNLEQFKNASYNDLIDIVTGWAEFGRQRRGQKVYS